MEDKENLTTRPLYNALATELAEGTELNGGQYRIVETIKTGGFGITYRALDNLDRPVALKECFPDNIAKRDSSRKVSAFSKTTAESFDVACRLFLREAKLLSQLSHPNVVHVQTLFEENGTSYMAMDLLEGEDLETLISGKPKSIEPERLYRFANSLLDALRHVHKNEMLHRDIKPSNIIIDQYNRPILIDFGAAKQKLIKQTKITKYSFAIVSDGYSPSEFYNNSEEHTKASDIYSLAATLYSAITGVVPPAASYRAHAVINGKPDPLRRISSMGSEYSEYDQTLLELIDQSMELEMVKRPQSTQVWTERLSAARANKPAVTNSDRSFSSIAFLVGGIVFTGAAIFAINPSAFLDDGMEDVHEELSAANAQIVDLSDDLQGSRQAVVEMEEQIAISQQDLNRAESARIRAVDDLDNAEQTLSAIRTQLEARQAELDETMTARDSALMELAGAHRTIEGLQAELQRIGDTPNDLSTITAARDRAVDDLADARRFIVELRADLRQNQDALLVAEDVQQRSATELEYLERALSEVQTQLDENQTELSEAVAARDRALADLEDSQRLVTVLQRETEQDSSSLTSSAAQQTAGLYGAACPSYETPSPWGNISVSAIDLLDGVQYQVNATGATPLTGCNGIAQAIASSSNLDPVGFFKQQPSLSVLLDETIYPSGLSQFQSYAIEVIADCDTTLLVNTPAANWFLDDDSGDGFNPSAYFAHNEQFIDFDDGGLQRVDIWVGTYAEGQQCTASIQLSAS